MNCASSSESLERPVNRFGGVGNRVTRPSNSNFHPCARCPHLPSPVRHISLELTQTTCFTAGLTSPLRHPGTQKTYRHTGKATAYRGRDMIGSRTCPCRRPWIGPECKMDA